MCSPETIRQPIVRHGSGLANGHSDEISATKIRAASERLGTSRKHRRRRSVRPYSDEDIAIGQVCSAIFRDHVEAGIDEGGGGRLRELRHPAARYRPITSRANCPKTATSCRSAKRPSRSTSFKWAPPESRRSFGQLYSPSHYLDGVSSSRRAHVLPRKDGHPGARNGDGEIEQFLSDLGSMFIVGHRRLGTSGRSKSRSRTSTSRLRAQKEML